MLIGLVGKPNVGKSTFFRACTMANVDIGNRPFVTISPNNGIGYVKIDCIENEFKVKCNPQKGYCIDGKRFVPVELIDVAGLVEGASEGKGLGNQFLDDLSSADALIHVIDISGETDAEGNETRSYNPINDVQMLENELDLWYLGILKKVWKIFSRTLKNTKQDFAKAVANQFSGLKVRENDVKFVLLKNNFNTNKSSEWSDDELLKFSHALRHLTKPMIIVANKFDKKNSKANLENLKNAYPELIIVGCSSDFELALREAVNHNLIKYIPGNNDFDIIGNLNEKQKLGLENIRKFLKENGSTGVQEVLNKVVFDLLKYIAVFPASANKLTDSKGNILPDCFLLKNGSTALDFAFTIHSDLGNNFIKAINARTSKAVGKDYKLKHRDALEIVTR